MKVKGRLNGDMANNVVLKGMTAVQLEEIQQMSKSQFAFFVNDLYMQTHNAVEFFKTVRSWVEAPLNGMPSADIDGRVKWSDLRPEQKLSIQTAQHNVNVEEGYECRDDCPVCPQYKGKVAPRTPPMHTPLRQMPLDYQAAFNEAWDKYLEAEIAKIDR